MASGFRPHDVTGFDLPTELAAVPNIVDVSCLILDDDLADMHRLCRLLDRIEGMRFSIKTASTIEDAVRLAESGDFNVFLIDFWMGSETAVSFVHDICLSRQPATLIMMSSLDEPEFHEIGLRAGAVQFLSKNELSAKNLESALRANLHHAERRTEMDDRVARFESAQRDGNDAALEWAQGIAGQIDRLRSHCLSAMDDARLTDTVVAAASLSQVLVEMDSLRAQFGDLIGDLDACRGIDDQKSERIDVTSLIGDVVADYLNAVDQGAPVIDFMADLRPVYVESDPALLSRAVTAILKSAECHPRPGTVVHIETAMRHGTCEIRISDDDDALADRLHCAEAGGGLDWCGADGLLIRDGTSGLVVADRIMRALGGSLSVVPGSDRPAVTLTLSDRGRQPRSRHLN